ICHPERLICPEPVTRQRYADGENRPEPPPDPVHPPWRRTDAEIQRALGNFRMLIRALRDMPGARLVTVGDLVARFGAQPATLPRDDLSTIAVQATEHAEIVLGGPISPAEALIGWAESIARWSETGVLPT